ncbi:MAG: GNAT family N-acetyltransferase [Bacteroidota bacterium]|nr:GNAT family N-acetyltransferase [Bacteroidota bacterium]
MLPIRYLRRKEIDNEAWNNCIREAANGLIYSYSYYLDAMADNWDGLVWGDYESVMPLPWRKKWGVSYLYQPFFSAQLGVFGNTLSTAVVEGFLKAIPEKFHFWEISLNYKNLYTLPSFSLHQRMNYVLPLHQPYETLFKTYRENIRRNIKKCGQYGGKVITEVAVEDIIKLVKFQATNISYSGFEAFTKLFHQLAQDGKTKTYGIVSAKGDLLASAVFFFSHKRAYYILVGNHPNGRTLGASHALIDAFIRDHAGQDLLLDFEGSDIRNLAFFYSSFGAQEECYAAIRLNRLPWWLRWMKD